MANTRRDPVGYRPFRAQPLLAEGLLAVGRPGGELLERVSSALFRVAGQAGQVADRQADTAGRLAGQQAALAGAPQIDAGTPAAAPAAGDATPAASDDLTSYLTDPGRKSHVEGLEKGFRTRLSSMLNSAPEGLRGKIKLMSGYRSPERQAQLFDAAVKKYGSVKAARHWVAPPGKSQHNHGNAYDLEFASDDARQWVHANAGKFGLAFPMAHEPWHIEPAGARGGGGTAPAGVDPAATAATASPGTPPSVTGGGFRPTGADTIYGRAYDEAGARTYVQMVDTEMRSTAGQLFDRYRDDPAGLEKAFGDLRTVFKQDHIFPEIEADFEVGFGRLAENYIGQARDGLRRKEEQVDRAAFIARTAELNTAQQRLIAGFDPASDAAAEAIAASQAAIDAHYDDAVRRDILDPETAEKAKIDGRQAAATGFYGKQAEALDADGVKDMREAMRKDFADGGVEGLDGESFAALDTSLKRLEENKRADAERATKDFAKQGDKFAARVAAGFEIEQAAFAEWSLKAGESEEGKAALAETQKKINAGRQIRDLDVNGGRKYVDGLRKGLGDNPTDEQVRTYAFADQMLRAKAKAIATDPVSYAEATGVTPETPMLTDAETPDALEQTVSARVDAAGEAAKRLGVAPRFLKAGEAKALAAGIRKNPETGAAIAASIVAGAGDAAPAVLSEFGADAPMVSEAGAILAFGGSARAAEDVILGYGKGPDGKALKGLKADAQRESFSGVAGGALALAGKDRERIDRAAAAITRKRIAEEGVDPASEEALAIHQKAVHEAAGGTFDRGEQYGGFVGWGGSMFATERKVLVPPSMRADLFGDVILSLTDADLAGDGRKGSPAPTGDVPGLLEPGNIDLAARPVVKNADGSVSTVRSMSFEENGTEILVPTVIGNRVVSNREAIDHYRKTGEHLGKFKTPDAATAYSQRLHESQAAYYSKGVVTPRPTDTPYGIVPSLTMAATLASATPVAVSGGYAFAYGDPTGADPQFVEGSDGKVFVLDIVGMRDRLAARVPGAFR